MLASTVELENNGKTKLTYTPTFGFLNVSEGVETRVEESLTIPKKNKEWSRLVNKEAVF